MDIDLVSIPLFAILVEMCISPEMKCQNKKIGKISIQHQDVVVPAGELHKLVFRKHGGVVK
jgi:hypothetical protein